MESRKAKTFKNLAFNIGAYAIDMVLSFITRTVFIYCLSKEYLGVGGLFSNILSILSVAELGAGGAFVSLLYKPLAENDTQKLSSVMSSFRKVFTGIATFIGIAGLSLTPILSRLTGETAINNINLIYVLYILNSVIGYLCTAKKSLIVADQRSYIVTKCTQIAIVIQYALQIVFLLLTKNYIIYLCIQIACSAFGNLYCARQANRLYPWLGNRTGKLDVSFRENIIQKIRAGFCVHFGTIIASGTDSIVITKFLGLEILGIYSNYILVLGICQKMMSLIYSSVKASACNFFLQHAPEERYQFFRVLNFLFVGAVGFLAVCLINLFNPFITVWLDPSFLLNTKVVILSVLIYAVGWNGVKIPLYITRDAFCLYTKDKYLHIMEGVANLGLSVWLVQKIGLAGVFIGTIASSMITWISCSYLVYKHAFNKSVWYYWRDILTYCIAFTAVGFGAWYICSLLTISSWSSFILGCVLCAMFVLIACFLLLRKTYGFKYIMANIIKPALNRFQS